jgi:site-specific DNA-methyltransferase (adenine-specific)
MIDKWKVISSRSGHEHAGNPGKGGKRRVLSKIAILPPGTICTETYLVIGSYANESEAKNLVKYMETRFFRFLLSLLMYSHSITRDTYSFIPILDMSKSWTNEKLYKRYKLTDKEIDLIESLIRPMELDDE